LATKDIEAKIDKLTKLVVAEHVVGIDERLDVLATKEQTVALHGQVNAIETQLRGVQHRKAPLPRRQPRGKNLRQIPRLGDQR
jgi:hypothetical protein